MVELRADCASCFALCCVGLTFIASVDFPVDKPAGEPCVNLTPAHRCGVHASLRSRGYAGCVSYDCIGAGTGFMGLTNLRLVIQDKSFVGSRTAITSIPYKNVRSVSFLSNKSWAGHFFSSSSIAVDIGQQTYEADFRGIEKAQHVHRVILEQITR